MAKAKFTPWRELAQRAHKHLGTARLLVDLIVDSGIPEPAQTYAKTLRGELAQAQGCVKSIAENPNA